MPLSLLLTRARQSLHVTSYQKHHFPHNHTGSCCCHGDWRLRLYASDCLSERTRLTADSGVFMCVVTQQLAASGRGRAVVRLLCETWNRFGPSSSQPLRQYGLYSSSEARIVRLERICAVTPAGLMSGVFFLKGSGLWSSAHDSSLILFLEKCIHSAVM